MTLRRRRISSWWIFSGPPWRSSMGSGREAAGIYVQAHFIPRCASSGEKATYIFSIEQFYADIVNGGPGLLSPADSFEAGTRCERRDDRQFRGPCARERQGRDGERACRAGAGAWSECEPRERRPNTLPLLAFADSEVEAGKVSVEVLVKMAKCDVHLEGGAGTSDPRLKEMCRSDCRRAGPKR